MDISLNLLNKNLCYLGCRDLNLVRQIRETDFSGLDFTIIKGLSETISISGIQLSSRHDPYREAATQVSCMNDLSAMTLYGIGLGYLPEKLLERKNLKNLNIKILNLTIFGLILCIRDQSNWIKDRRVEVSLADTDDNVKLPYFVSPPDLLLADDATQNIKNILLTDKIDLFSRRQFQASESVLLKRMRENYVYIKQDEGVEFLAGITSEKDAIVVASGPSLNSSLSRLKARYFSKQRPIVISVGTATQLLINSKIIPDYVVIIDKDVNFSHPLVSDSLQIKKTTLIYSPLVSPNLLEEWEGSRFVAYSDSPLFNEIKSLFPKGSLFSGGSVIHAAVDLARSFGCRNIILFGVDFAYNDETTHAGHNGSPLLNYENIASPNDSKRSVMNGYGKNVPTHDSFITYLVELERYIECNPRIKFWNTSRTGAFIKGCEYLEDLA